MYYVFKLVLEVILSFSSFLLEKVLCCIFFVIMHECLVMHFFSIIRISNCIEDYYSYPKFLTCRLCQFYLLLVVIKDELVFRVVNEYRCYCFFEFISPIFCLILVNLCFLRYSKYLALSNFCLLHLNST